MQDAVEDSIGQTSDGGQPFDGEVDYDCWGRMPGWTMSEAAALLLGHDPDRMNLAENRQHEPGSPGWKYKRLHRMLARACEMEKLSDPEVPRVLLEPVRMKVESGEAVVIPWSALLFQETRRCGRPRPAALTTARACGTPRT